MIHYISNKLASLLGNTENSLDSKIVSVVSSVA